MDTAVDTWLDTAPAKQEEIPATAVHMGHRQKKPAQWPGLVGVVFTVAGSMCPE